MFSSHLRFDRWWQVRLRRVPYRINHVQSDRRSTILRDTLAGLCWQVCRFLPCLDLCEQRSLLGVWTFGYPVHLGYVCDGLVNLKLSNTFVFEC